MRRRRARPAPLEASCGLMIGVLATLLGGAALQVGPAPAVAQLVPAAPGAWHDQPASTRPDTLVARFSWREGDEPVPVSLTPAPTVARLGEVVAVILAGAPQVDWPAAEAVQVDVDWLEPVPVAAELVESLERASVLETGDRSRLITAWRVYRLGPWQAAWADGPAGEVLQVAGRLDAQAPILPVRDPRAAGGLPRWLPWLLLATLLLGCGLWLWRRWRGRSGPPVAADQPLPPPAWLQAALDLSDLDRGVAGVPPAGRAYLDRLAGILRRYLQDRFHLPAVEMTAAELAPAARRAGWPADQLEGFLQVLATCDRLRYAPPEVSARHCRDCLGQALASIERVRVEPVWSPVPPSQLAAASHAWQDLRARHPSHPAVPEGERC
jgi:hypothetical protein